MDRLKKNAGLKCAAAIVLSVSLVALAVSSVLGLYFFDHGVFEPTGRDAIYQGVVEGISWNYDEMAMEYYTEVVRLVREGKDNEEIEQQTRHYKEMFAEENCNYAFRITPVDSEVNEEYPSLSNYSCDDFQFSSSSTRDILVYDERAMFEYPIYTWYVDMQAQQTENYDAGDAYQDEYYEQEYFAYVENGDIWISNNRSSYNLSRDAEYRRAWNEFCEEQGSNADILVIDYSYDEEQGVLYQDVSVSEVITVNIEACVKSDFTAHDDFYNSLLLRYLDVVIDVTIPVFVISLILVILCSVYLIAAAGHRKGQEEITFNGFDRIPFDIICAFVCMGCCGAVIASESIYSFYSIAYTGFGILSCVGLLIAFPAIIMTTATRIKVSGWGMFKNTVIWRLCSVAWRLLKWIWNKCVSVISYLIRHMNLYWKYVGVLLLFGLIEFFAVSTGSMGAVAIIGVLELFCLCLIVIRALVDMNSLKKGAEELASGNTGYEINTSQMMWEFRNHGENLNRIKDGIQVAVEARMKSERMKTELITNVSHDIKTPLTSIISYVDLLKKEKIDNPTALEYVDVLDRQSARLKKLIQDLIDASKASTGNLTVHMEETDIRVLLEQAMGEFAEKMEKRALRTVITYNTDPVIVMADGQHLWRIFQNIINNIAKYAQDNTRVYIDVDGEIAQQDEGGIVKRSNLLKVTFKNISRDALNVSGDELMERFVRGDSSRNTEGSGLGLSIARSLIELQGGNLEIIVDGDLFKVVLLLVRA